MAGFEPINTQEEFDERIKSRLERERNTISKQYADYESLRESNSALTNEKTTLMKSIEEKNEEINGLNQKLSEANTKLKSLEIDSLKTKVAVETGLPFELKDRLSGETEEAIREDASALSKIFKTSGSSGIPGFDGSNKGKEPDPNEAYKDMLKNLKGE